VIISGLLLDIGAEIFESFDPLLEIFGAPVYFRNRQFFVLFDCFHGAVDLPEWLGIVRFVFSDYEGAGAVDKHPAVVQNHVFQIQ